MEIIKIAPRAKRSGMIMPLVATITVFIFLIGIAMLKIGFGSRFIAARTSSEITARTAADAGLASAIHLMNGTWDREPFSVTPTPLQNTRAAFSYNVTGGPNFTIRSTGVSDQISRTVYAMTWATSFWSYAIAVEDTITLRSNMVLDVWPEDSTFVPTIATTSTEPGAITLAPNTEIPGDIVVGPGSDPDIVVDSKASSVVHGDMYAGDSDMEFPPIYPPVGLPQLAWPRKPNGMIIQTDCTYITPVLFGNGDRISIVGDVTMYVTGNMRLNNGAELYIGPGSSLALYVGGSLIADNGSIITNAEQDARNLRIYGTPTCTHINIRNSGQFWGAIYAPSADLNITNSGTMYGSFIGNSFEMDNQGEFYYDTRLYNYDPTGGLSFFQIERWWERGDEGI